MRLIITIGPSRAEILSMVRPSNRSHYRNPDYATILIVLPNLRAQ